MPHPRTNTNTGAGLPARRKRENTPPALFGAGADRHLRVAWYRRASTDEGNQPFSLEAQEARLGAYTAAQPGWEFVTDYVERASGKDVEGRPELQRLLRDATNGAFDLVLVARLDRWSRDLVDCLDTVDHLTEHNVAFHSASEHFDTSTPTGVLMLQILGMFAQFERASIIDRVRRGNRAKLDRGLPLTRRVGYGLRVDDPGVLTSDPATIAVVNRIYSEYVNDKHGAKAIAAGLNDDGIPTGGQGNWSADSVLRVLRNRAFIGEVRHRDEWLDGAHGPLIDTAVFHAAEALLVSRSKPATAAATGSDFLLTGTISCARCGGAYVGTRGTGRSGTTHRYYSCVTARRYGAKRCTGPSLPAGELESLVIEELVATYADHDLFRGAVAAHLAERETRTEPVRDQLRAQHILIAERESTLARYRRDYQAGHLSAQLYSADTAAVEEQLTALRDHAAALEAQLDVPPPEVPDEATLARLHERLHHQLRHGNTEVRRSLCGTLIASLVVHDRDDIAPTFRLLTPGEGEDFAHVSPEAAPQPGRGMGPATPEMAETGGVFAHRRSGWSLGDSNP